MNAAYTLYGLPYTEVQEAIFFYQKFKLMPTFIETAKQIKREHLEAELERLQNELDSIL